MFVEAVEYESKTDSGFTYGFNVEFVLSFKNNPVMNFLAIDEFVEPRGALYIPMLRYTFELSK
jgi:hypothetical protein